MTPELRDRWTDHLLGSEGLVLRAYDDATGRVIAPGTTVRGFVTVGIGRNLIGRGITRDEAFYLCANDQAAVLVELDRLIPWWRELVEARQLVLADMAYNMGAERFVRGWPHFLAAVKAGDWKEAARLMRESRWAAQVGDRDVILTRLMLEGHF